MKCNIVAAFSLGLLLAPSVCSSDWIWQHPLPAGNTLRAAAQGQELVVAAGDCGTIVRLDRKTRQWQHVASLVESHLRAIAFVFGTTWVAVGSGGTILRSTDSGLDWTPVESGARENLYGLAFGGPDFGIAVGSGGTLLVTQNGGESWTRRGTGVQSTLRSVAILSPREAVAAGEAGVILKTGDAGMNWKQRKVAANLYSVVARGDHLIAVGGEAGYFRNRRVIFRSTDRGDNWNVELDESGPVLYGVSIAADGTAVASGESGTLMQKSSRDSAWTKAKSPTKHLLAAVIHSPKEVLAVGSFGIVATSTDGGKSWNANFSEKQKELYSVSFYDAAHGVAVGDEGRILYTANGGRQWQVSKSGFKAGLQGVSMISPTAAVAVGGEGLVLRSTDGGQSWGKIASGTDLWLRAVDFADERSGLAVGYSTILATGDGGNSWAPRSIPAGVGDTVFLDAAYANKSVAAIVGALGVILTSTDGGRTWTYRRTGSTQHLLSVAWSDPQHATAVGDKGIVLSTADAGQTWAVIPSGVDQRLTGVAYINDREGFAAGDSGILLYTKDGGRSWTPERRRTLNHLRSLFCRPGTPLFAAGWNATILRRDVTQPAGQR